MEGSFGQLQGALKNLSGTAIEGYEIHMGVSTLNENAVPTVRIRDTNVEGAAEKEDGAQQGNVYGTYVHSVFDREMVADRIVEALGQRKGMDTSDMTGVDYQTFKESQYDILAEELRRNMDLKKIYGILDAGV